ncbi:MFS transporter [Ruicaihuangia caeni]|uniref:MFS transporter n=1 Tax=Ruicaihuangia caeni TaxID=3042517 RepID=UPI00338E421D
MAAPDYRPRLCRISGGRGRRLGRVSADAGEFKWRTVMLAAVAPTLVFSIGEGAIVPVIPLVATALGSGLAGAGLVASLLTIGALLGTLPGARVVQRLGERRAMIGAAAVSAGGVLLAALAPNPALLAAGILLIGLSAAVFGLARLSFMTLYVPLQYRARSLSTLGGSFRLGYFIGPFASAGVIALSHDPQTAMWVHLAACLATVAILLVVEDPEASYRSQLRGPAAESAAVASPEAAAPHTPTGVIATMRSRRDVLARLGVGAMLVSALRISRQVIVPLWAVSIGIPAAETALIIGIAGALDFALFYTGGQIMDRYGRLWTAVPSMLGLAAGHLTLALTHNLPSAQGWFIAAAMVLAVANSLGSGLIMTLGADLARGRHPASFLSVWRFTAESGGALAPVLISAITVVASLSWAAAAMGALGVLGAGILMRYLPRFVPKTHRSLPPTSGVGD